MTPLEARNRFVDALTFEEVSDVNLERALVWHPLGLDEWSVADWAVAMAGEAGEVCNAVKKLRRIDSAIVQAEGPQSRATAIAKIASEIGDTFLYLDLLARRLNIHLPTAIAETFNRVSVREGFPHRVAMLAEIEKEKNDAVVDRARLDADNMAKGLLGLETDGKSVASDPVAGRKWRSRSALEHDYIQERAEHDALKARVGRAISALRESASVSALDAIRILEGRDE